ncbi:hypothetical protein BHU72_00940 [Desulfuribacillus stibiiarsenatis]|uniref:PrcB C-terminal domain-containing protein n=1 Tax=Desulfuribacillus stibiiarsenatis TaxID=1390249 RepID=A0A1E5L9N1_9FIRM|nr:protease complex subunit PrcB family protein [Desulfuribacillus stibiiarsenatis]OEH86862.1 hypothetical protein BHU72_00940 [Desulfuribacillus stibiiarsenatis]
MTRQTIIPISIFVLCMVLLMGCGGAKMGNEDTKPTMSDVDYEIIDIEELELKEKEEIVTWYDDVFDQEGVHSMDGTKGFSKYTYILIADGEKATGGYAIQIESMKGNEDEIRIVAKVREPQKGEFVTQAFGYPHLLLRINQDSRKILLEKQ